MNDDKIFKLSKKNKIEVKEMLNSKPRISPPCTPCYTCTDDGCKSQIVFCRRKELGQQKEPEKVGFVRASIEICTRVNCMKLSVINDVLQLFRLLAGIR